MVFPNIQSSSRSMLGFKRNMQKCNGVSDVLASSQQIVADCSKVITLYCHSDNNLAHLIRLWLEQNRNAQ